MTHPTTGEYYALVLAALTLMIVLVSCSIAAQLHRSKTGAAAGGAPAGAKEGFLAPMWYNPVCRSDFLRNTRAECRGYTSGQMPSISDGMDGGWLCPGMIGVPI